MSISLLEPGYFFIYDNENLYEKEEDIMKLCFCRLLHAVVILVVALVWWPETWAKWVIVVVAGIAAIMSLFYNACCLAKKKMAEE